MPHVIEEGPKLPIVLPTAHIACLCSSIVSHLGPAYAPIAQQRPTWLISGTKTTNRDGRANVTVNDFLHIPECANINASYHGPAIISSGLFFVTAIHDSPVVLNYTLNKTEIYPNCIYRDVFDETKIYPSQTREWEIVVNVRSWDLTSNPLAYVEFSWMYLAEAALRECPM